METRGTWKPHSLRNSEAPSDCIKYRLTIVKQRCALFYNPTHHKSIHAGAITDRVITVPDYYYVPHCDTAYWMEEQTEIWPRPMKRQIASI